jgi:hypothetical protein
MRKSSRLRIPLILGAMLVFAPSAGAKEIHLDCARSDQTVMVGLDTDRRYLEIMWSEGVAEEYAQGDSYISGPDSFGEKEKVTYVVTIDKDLVTFGQDRACLQSGTKRKCVDSQTRDTLDLAKSELKYNLGDEIAVFKCQPAPPGRRF